jgi:hypothetical protein
MQSHMADDKAREQFDTALLAPLDGWDAAEGRFMAAIMAADDEERTG